MTDFTIQNEQSPFSYFTQKPNIIYELGLDPFQHTVYDHLCRVANTGNQSWYANKKFSAICGISERKLIEVKKELSQPREDLNGKSLINIVKRWSKEGDRDTDLITIIDVWPENIKKFMGHAQDAGGVVHSVHKGGAQRAYKQEPLNKTKGNNNTTEQVVSVVSSENDEKKALLNPLELTQKTCRLALEYSLKEVSLAVDCCLNAKEIASMDAYFTKAIKESWKPSYPKEVQDKVDEKNKEQNELKESVYEKNRCLEEIRKIIKENKDRLNEGFILIDNGKELIAKSKENTIQLKPNKDVINWLHIWLEKAKR